MEIIKIEEMCGVNNKKYPIELIVTAMISAPLPNGLKRENERMEVDFLTLDGVLFYNIKLWVLNKKKKLRIMKMLPQEPKN